MTEPRSGKRCGPFFWHFRQIFKDQAPARDFLMQWYTTNLAAWLQKMPAWPLKGYAKLRVTDSVTEKIVGTRQLHHKGNSQGVPAALILIMLFFDLLMETESGHWEKTTFKWLPAGTI